jgi:iron(II)-dependent oxidoreductase
LLWPPARVDREPLWLPAARLQLGSERGGFVPDNERWADTVSVPEFEIDAQAVSWERYIEFAEDGGYDRTELWTEAGRQWLQAHARRAPRDVEQLRGGVLLQRGGELQRAPAGQPRCTCPATRPRPGAAGPAAACRPNPNGNWRP